jgi:hypothetical protein
MITPHLTGDLIAPFSVWWMQSITHSQKIHAATATIAANAGFILTPTPRTQ